MSLFKRRKAPAEPSVDAAALPAVTVDGEPATPVPPQPDQPADGGAAPSVTPPATAPTPAPTLAPPPAAPPAGGDTLDYPIVPLLQPAAWYRDACAQIPDRGWWPIVEELPNDLALTFALDRPEAFETVTTKRAEALGLTRQDLAAEARATLDQRAAGVVLEGRGGRYRVELPDCPDLAASLILNTPVWLKAGDIAGQPVLAIGRRIMLHVCGSDDGASVAGLAALNRNLYESPPVEGKALDPRLFTVDLSGQVQAYQAG
ncbi:MAG: hypothetical protein LBR33_09025 [Propionibacteriaceae bacterium]|jgi:hypothetical protein|nr:hypothetical protein [Propionibacteriaceae bacterium]